MDSAIVEDELDFFGIDLENMIERYEELERKKRPPYTPSLREQIHKTIRI